MHAHHVVELIGPPGLRWVEVPEPDTTAQLVVEVMAAGVSFADLLYTRGRYQVRPTLPFAPGMDAAGVVRSAPPGSGFEAGQRVAVLAAYGCWQDVITADPSWTLPLPDDMGFEAGAAAPLNYLTSLFALVRRGQAQPGEVLLVHGAADGIPRIAPIRRCPDPSARAVRTAQIRSAAYALRNNTVTGNNTCVTMHARHRVRRGRSGSLNPSTRRTRAYPQLPSTPLPHVGHPFPPAASRDSTRTGSTSTVTIGASKHYSAAPRKPAKT